MTDEQLLERITFNRNVMAGKPVIKGTRLTVDYILGLLAHGATAAEITLVCCLRPSLWMTPKSFTPRRKVRKGPWRSLRLCEILPSWLIQRDLIGT